MTSPALDVPTTDEAAAHPEIEELRTLLRNRDWPGVEAFFARLPDDRARTYLTRAVGDLPGSEQFLAEQVERESSPGLASTMLGVRYVKQGWEIRTSKRAQYVSREQFAALHEYLCRAERLLIDATAARPDNVAAWCERLNTVRGLALGQSEARRRYDRLARTDPHNLSAQWAMVQQLCPKWSGSWDALFPFARDCAWSAPPGAVNPAVLVEAHVERSYDADGGYFRRDEVRKEIYEAADRSVNHPDFRPVYGWVYAHNLFAYVFSVMGDDRSAAQSFRAIGNRMARVVWSGYADPVAEFRKVRDTALAKG